MQKDYHHKTQVPINFKNLRHKILYRIVVFCIKHKLFQNSDKFKAGDKIMYNWRAKVYINSCATDKIYIVRGVRKHSDSSVSILIEMGASLGDAFWFKKVK